MQSFKHLVELQLLLSSCPTQYEATPPHDVILPCTPMHGKGSMHDTQNSEGNATVYMTLTPNSTPDT